MRDVIELGSVKASLKLKGPVKIDLDGIEPMFTICIIIEQYEKKRLTKIKNLLNGTPTTRQMFTG